MADTMTPDQRHHCMSSIGSRDTQPEMIVRRALWHHGFRYRLCDPRLPGSPDIVLRRWRTVVMVNGCFWHGHDCDVYRQPSTNSTFWRNKVERNRARDRRDRALLQALGYNVITVWECQLRPAVREQTLASLLRTLSQIVLERSSLKPAAKQSSPSRYPAIAPATEPMAAEPETHYGKS